LGIGRFLLKKMLDNALGDAYPTPSMSMSSSPDILEMGACFVHAWTERGDLQNAREEEGGQEGHEEEEVTGCPGKGGVSIHPPLFFSALTKKGARGRIANEESS
jgi:hypothetical protein